MVMTTQIAEVGLGLFGGVLCVSSSSPDLGSSSASQGIRRLCVFGPPLCDVVPVNGCFIYVLQDRCAYR